jgi:hypothetical protein
LAFSSYFVISKIAEPPLWIKIFLTESGTLQLVFGLPCKPALGCQPNNDQIRVFDRKQPVFMRVIGEIPHPDCKITLFQWNNRYLIKLEAGLLEQTFKVPEYDVTAPEALAQIANPRFVDEALARFADMQQSLQRAMDDLPPV